MFANITTKYRKTYFFIDCNPGFAIYTELAIFASDRLIVPCTGDFASLRGVKNVVETLYNPSGDVKDCDNISLVVNYNGTPISKLEHRQYKVYEADSHVNQSQITPFLCDIQKVIDLL